MLIRNGIVLTQDPSLGELPRADVLVEGDTIAAVGPNLSAEGAEVIDAEGDIVIPGFIDTHRHTWETSIRTCAPDYTLGAYFGAILDKFAPHYRPDDGLRREPCGARFGVRNAGDHDARRLVAHHEHPRALPTRRSAASGRSGIRSVVRVRLPRTLSTPGTGGSAGLRRSVLEIDGDLARRPSGAEYFNSDDSLITMALATRGTNFCREEVVRHEWELAKELGLNITVHVAMYRFGYTKMQLTKLKEMDLLYPNTTYIHSSHLLDDEWAMVRDSGSNVSYAPQIELQMGHGWAQAVTARDYGVPIGLSSDVATTASSDQFTQMHAIFASERARRYEIAWDENLEVERAREQADLVAGRPRDGDDRRRAGRRHRRSDGVDHAGQEGRPRDHRRPRRQRRAGSSTRSGRWYARPTSRTSTRSSSAAGSSSATASCSPTWPPRGRR
jgi:hypothetical protein